MTSTVIQNDVYAELVNKYPTSEALLAWLSSTEGGSLAVHDSRRLPDDPVVLISYTDKSDKTLPHVPYFRSVIWNLRANRPVCASPVASSASESFTSSTFVAEEFVDGVMLNMFWDEKRAAWRIASRSQMDAPNTYYSRRPFYELFSEAVAANSLDLGELSREYTYSWVLQHPAERVVTLTPYGIPRIRLVEMARFLENGTQLITRDPHSFLPSKFRALLPESHEVLTVQDVFDRIAAWGHRFGTQWKGLVIKDTKTAKQWSFQSEQYKVARELRGTSAKLPFVWLERWADQKLNQYLKLYPEEMHEASKVVDSFKACTQEAFDLYHQVYRAKAFPLREAPQKYRKLLWELHQARAGAYFPTLRDFMNKQDTARKLWLVNYEVRYPNSPVPAALNADAVRDAQEANGLAAVAAEDAALEAEQHSALEMEASDVQQEAVEV